MAPTRPQPLTFLYWSLIATSALAAVLVIGTFWLAARTQVEDAWVRHTLTVRDRIAQTFILVQRAESSARGYLLTGSPAFLKPYKSSTTALPAALDKMAILVGDSARQRHSLAQLRKLVRDKMAELSGAINEEKADHIRTPIAIGSPGTDLKTMLVFRHIVAAMTAEEDQLLARRQARSATFGMLLQLGANASFLLICAVGILIGFTTKRSFTELATARDHLMLRNQELLEQITLRENAESQLRQAQKMEAIGQLTAGIAHDFNNMLGVISASLDLIQRRLRKGDLGVDRFMEAAIKATERAGALTHRLLAFTRQQPLSPEPLDANEMIANMSDLLRATFGEHIAVQTVAAAGLWRTRADAHQLENAILNVAINAHDAMQGGGRLTIETANADLDEAYCRRHGDVNAGQFVMIAMTDTGTGMKPEIAARAFDPFFTTKPAGSGTGLGLSQVYGFVKQSHGHIKISSELGAGTTVKIYLPRFIGEARQTAGPAAMPLAIGKADETILVVEDDPLMRRLTTEALRELSYTVYASENASDALAILNRTPGIKLLFTDVIMPDINGRMLADEATRRRTDLKVLFTTGSTPNTIAYSGMLDAGVPFIAKPFTLEQLAAKVRRALDA